jgi:hypothetical protein
LNELIEGPKAIVSIYYGSLVDSNYGRTLIQVGNTIGFSYHALNILLLIFTNRKFYKELKILLHLNKNNNSPVVAAPVPAPAPVIRSEVLAQNRLQPPAPPPSAARMGSISSLYSIYKQKRRSKREVSDSFYQMEPVSK